MCDGTLLSRSTYAPLFSVIGTRFGASNAFDFRAPDLRGKFLRGRAGGTTWIRIATPAAS
jgi:microcystin-dependent protein